MLSFSFRVDLVPGIYCKGTNNSLFRFSRFWKVVFEFSESVTIFAIVQPVQDDNV